MLALGIICAIGASALYNTSIALQALEAREVGHEHALRASLIGRLIRNPRWLVATLIGLLGWPLEIVALLLAPLTVVQPCLASGLVLLLWLGVTRLGERPGRREYGAVGGDRGRGRRDRLGGARTDDRERRDGADRDRARAGDDPGRRPLRRARAGERGGDAGGRRRRLRLRLDGDRLEAPHRRTLGGLAARRGVWLATAAASEGLALLSEMSALGRRPATRVAPVMFAVQVVVPVILAPLIFEESWSGTPGGGAGAGRRDPPGPRRRRLSGRFAGGRRGDRVRSCRGSSQPVERESLGELNCRFKRSPPVSLLALRRFRRRIALTSRRNSFQDSVSRTPKKEPAVGAAETSLPDVTKFAIGFDHRDRPRLFELWTEVLDSEQWSEGEKLAAFEERWAEWNKLPSVGLSSWAGGALAALEFAGVKGETVLCPSNTFMATPLAAIGAGAKVEFVDCRKDDLCMSFEDFERKAEQHKPRAAILVHVGGHLVLRLQGDRRILPRPWDLPARGLRPRPRRRLGRRPPRQLRRRRRLLALRDQDGLQRRGRRARLRRRGAASSTPASSATTASSTTRSTASTSG